jgi:hypothetical protein
LYGWCRVLRAIGRHRDADEKAGFFEREIGVLHQLHRQNACFVVLVEAAAHHVSFGKPRIAIADHDVVLCQGRQKLIISGIS